MRAAYTGAVLVLLAGGLTGGAPSDLSGTPATSAGSPARSDAETIGAAGSYDVLVQRVDPARGTMTVDAVQYFTGLAAARACAEDGVPDQRGTLCHEFYIRDRSSRLWTVPLSADADIAVRAGGCGPARSIAIDDLAAGLTRHRLFRLDISDGVGIRLTEPCGP